VIKQEHYNTTWAGYKKDSRDVSYPLVPAPNPDNGSHKMTVIIVSAVFLAVLLCGFALCSCRRKKRAAARQATHDNGNTEYEELNDRSASHTRHHLQTMTTGRGTDVESSHVYNSVLEERESMLKGSIKN